MSNKIKVRIGGPDGNVKTFRGRFAWALDRLITAGDAGITSLTHPAPRLSHYVHILRRNGVTIETLDEKHAGDFPGVHGRYVLRSPVVVLETETSEAA